jgi:ATPase subunit of ABC transporter with duplicated ATPase domains
LCTRIIEVTQDGLREFPGGYAEYIQNFGVDHLDREGVARASREQSREQQRRSRDLPESNDSLSWEEQKRLRNRKKQLPKLRLEAEAAIAGVERRQKEIQAAYATPGFFESKSPAEITALRKEESGLGPKLERLLHDWEALERENVELEKLKLS